MTEYFERALQSGIADRLGVPKSAVDVRITPGLDGDRSIWVCLARPLGTTETATVMDVMTSLSEIAEGKGHGAGIYVCKDPLENPTDIFIQPNDPSCR